MEVLEDVGADANMATNARAVDNDRLISDVVCCGLKMDDEEMVGGKSWGATHLGAPFSLFCSLFCLLSCLLSPNPLLLLLLNPLFVAEMLWLGLHKLSQEGGIQVFT